MRNNHSLHCINSTILESYREDFNDANEYFNNVEDKQEFYINMKSGAESGWDYSTKWYIYTILGEITSEIRFVILFEITFTPFL